MIPGKSILEVMDLKTHFFTKRGLIKAVDGVSFTLKEGECLGLAGESGSGKSVTCLSILRLVPQPAGQIVGGRIYLEGEDLLEKSEEEMRRIRGAKISMILQDPLTSLNPVFKIGDQVGEALKIHQGFRGSKLRTNVAKILTLLGIPSARDRLNNYPHQMSGGMRQRVVGAIAISCQPKVLLADEPTTSLDATIQAQYLRLLKDIQEKRNLSILFVTHDFGILARMCDRVSVMYAGKIVETAPMSELFKNPRHPYTAGLIKSVPRLRARDRLLFSIPGEPPTFDALPTGCSFEPRCSLAIKKCRFEYPPQAKAENGHIVYCWRATQ